MQISDIKIGKSLEIFVDREGYNYHLVSKVEYVKENTVYITLIESRVRTFQFKEGDKIDIIYRIEDRMWKWNKVNAGEIILDGTRVHYFTSAEPAETYNRRNAFRVSVGEKLIIQYLESESEEELSNQDVNNKETKEIENKTISQVTASEDIRFKSDSQIKESAENNEDGCVWLKCEAYIRDISEVGAGFFTNQKFVNGDNIKFELATNFGVITCQGDIVRCSENVHGVFRNYYGCSFTETSKNLNKFIFEMQRIQLKKAKEKEFK